MAKVAQIVSGAVGSVRSGLGFEHWPSPTYSELPAPAGFPSFRCWQPWGRCINLRGPLFLLDRELSGWQKGLSKRKDRDMEKSYARMSEAQLDKAIMYMVREGRDLAALDIALMVRSSRFGQKS